MFFFILFLKNEKKEPRFKDRLAPKLRLQSCNT
jgi:hypothetical protein